MEKVKSEKELRELKRKLDNTVFVNAVELPKKQVVIYVSEEAVTLLHIPSGREKALLIPIDDFVKRVSDDTSEDKGTTTVNSAVEPAE